MKVVTAWCVYVALQSALGFLLYVRPAFEIASNEYLVRNSETAAPSDVRPAASRCSVNDTENSRYVALRQSGCW